MSGFDGPRRFVPAVRDIGDALRFFTRMPLGEANASAPLDINRFAWAAPVAGVAVGLVGALALALTGLIGLPPLIRAGLATAALVAATGALHEDGLADVADGFGGGATRAMKLDIMRDSRIGAYGAIALALALILRVARADGGARRRLLARFAQPDRRRSALARRRTDPARAPRARRAPTAPALRRAGSSPERSPPRGARPWSSRLPSASLPRPRPTLLAAALASGAPRWRWSRSRAARSAARPATSPARRNSSPKSPPGAAFSSGTPPPK